MKRNILILISLYAVQAYAQKHTGFTLKGNIEGISNGVSVYLTGVKGDTVAKSTTHNSAFEFKGNIPGEANYYFIKTDSSIVKNGSNALWLINAKMNVIGSIKDWKNLELIGSEPHDEYAKLRALAIASKGSGKELDIMKNFVKQHPNSLYVANLISKIPFTVEERENAYGNLTPCAKNSYWGLELAKEIKRLKALVSGQIPNFNVTTDKGRKVSIRELASEAKYTLIDFWASWCGPCRSTIPEMKRVYDSFKDKGFNIIGVSTDKSETAWKKALAEDKTPWLHGLDNLESASSDIFGMFAIPGYLLIDREGKIIQTDYLSQSGAIPIKRFKDKSLGTDLYEVIDALVRTEKDK